jgi:protein involved in polysaccharide export with SLBB domain
LADKGGDLTKVSERTRSEVSSETIVLPVKGLNIPFCDVALHEGDSVIVERLVMPIFTVVGLVNRAGNFEYPPDVNYNLVQALGFANGLNLSLDPRYVTVYRLKQDGSIARASFKLKDNSRLTLDLAIPILPGDIIAVEHTPRTRTTQFLNNVFRVSIGTYIRTEDLFN